jgi:hypothetical protein
MSNNQQSKAVKAAKLILEMKGVIDCIAGIPARRNNPHYMRGYGNQYEKEQMRTGISEVAI